MILQGVYAFKKNALYRFGFQKLSDRWIIENEYLRITDDGNFPAFEIEHINRLTEETLLNASAATNFVYKINSGILTNNEIDQINSINSSRKLEIEFKLYIVEDAI